MKDIEIKSVESVEVAIPSKITLYCCIHWFNGVMFANTPSTNKQQQEQYAYGMAKHSDTCHIYKFEVDTPNMGGNK
jgi:hypothetical protein